jgi:hypothetical protein
VDELSSGSTEPIWVTTVTARTAGSMLHHGRALVTPYGDEAAFVELVAQLRQRQGGDFQHIDAAQRRHPHPQGLAAQPVMVGGRVLFGKPLAIRACR